MPKKSDRQAGYFGSYGGRFVPETLMAPLEELAKAYDRVSRQRKFQRRLKSLLANYAGRPTPLYLDERLSERLGGVRIFLKREDLLHTGAHKINNAIGQALLAQHMGKLNGPFENSILFLRIERYDFLYPFASFDYRP